MKVSKHFYSKLVEACDFFSNEDNYDFLNTQTSLHEKRVLEHDDSANKNSYNQVNFHKLRISKCFVKFVFNKNCVTKK